MCWWRRRSPAAATEHRIVRSSFDAMAWGSIEPGAPAREFTLEQETFRPDC
jgi:hypothetical protein